MKKIFTLATALVFALCASAQETTVTPVAKKLTETLVFYTTNDTVTQKMGIVVDEETGEEYEAMAPAPWLGTSMVNAFNNVGIPFTGAPAYELSYRVFTRNDYKDPRTGFEMPAGAYRGMLHMAAPGGDSRNVTSSHTGTIGTEKLIGYTNIKSIVLYVIPIPATCDQINFGVNDPAIFGGRVQARYMNADGTQHSNTGYREIKMNMTADPNYQVVGPEGSPIAKYKNIRGTKLLNFYRTDANPFEVVVDQPLRIEVKLDNQLNGADYGDASTIFDASDDVNAVGGYKKSEFKALQVADDATEAEMNYYFAVNETTYPYKSNANAHNCSSGYDCMNDKWGEKITWTPETIVDLQIKSPLYIVGMAFVSATDGAESRFMNASDDFNAQWSPTGVAYGNHGAKYEGGDATGIDNIVNVENDANTTVYNVAGQIVGENYKGLVIKNGKKVVIK